MRGSLTMLLIPWEKGMSWVSTGTRPVESTAEHHATESARTGGKENTHTELENCRRTHILRWRTCILSWRTKEQTTEENRVKTLGRRL